MPVKVLGLRQVFPALRQYQTCAVVGQHFSGRIITTVEMLAEDHLVAVGQNRECAQIEYLVMQRTQGKPIGHNVRSLCLKPFDMSGLETDGLPAEAKIVAADTATILVGEQNLFAKGRIAAPNLFLN